MGQESPDTISDVEYLGGGRLSHSLLNSLLHDFFSEAADSALWDEMGAFIEDLHLLTKDKLRQRELVREPLRSTLASLKTDNKAVMAHFDYQDVSNWSAEACPLAELDACSEELSEFTEALAGYWSIRQTQPKSISEERDQRTRLDKLDQRIVALHGSLSSRFSADPVLLDELVSSDSTDDEPVETTSNGSNDENIGLVSPQADSAAVHGGHEDSQPAPEDSESEPQVDAATHEQIEMAPQRVAGEAPTDSDNNETDAPNEDSEPLAQDHSEPSHGGRPPEATDSNSISRQRRQLKRPNLSISISTSTSPSLPDDWREVLPGQAVERLNSYLVFRADLPKAYMLESWLKHTEPDRALALPDGALIELAYFAFQPASSTDLTTCPDITPLVEAVNAPAHPELSAASWFVAAALALLRGESSALRLLPAKPDWMAGSDFASWHSMAEAVLTYGRKSDLTLQEARRRLPSKSQLQDPASERKAAEDALAKLTRMGSYNFLKGKRLSSHMEKEFAWLRQALAAEKPSEEVIEWVKKFDPDRQLDRWDSQVEPLTVRVDGPKKQAILRDLRLLHKHVERWANIYSAKAVRRTKQDGPSVAYEQLRRAIGDQSSVWRRTWEESRSRFPILVGWSSMFLDEIERVISDQVVSYQRGSQ